MGEYGQIVLLDSWRSAASTSALSTGFESVFLDLFYTGRLVKAEGVVFIDDARRG